MKILFLLIFTAVGAWAQCGQITLNPFTGLLDCTGPAAAGTVTVVGGGSLTNTAIVTGGGTTTLQTPCATCTLSAAGQLATTSVTVGSGPALTSGTGGSTAYSEGTAPSVGPAAGVTVVYSDSTQHGLMASYNNAAYKPLVQGPTSATSANLASFSGTNGGLLQDSGVATTTVMKGAAACAAVAQVPYITSAGTVTCSSGFSFASSVLQAPTGFTIGGVTSGSPGIFRDSNDASWLAVRFGDNSDYAPVNGSTYFVRSGHLSLVNSGSMLRFAGNTASLAFSSSAVLEIGDGDQNANGSLLLTNITASGSAVIFSGLGSATGTPDSVCLNTNTLKRNAALTCTVSSRDFKTGIEALTAVNASSLLMQLEPAQFAYNDHPERTRWGFISEQVAGVDRRFADGWDANGVPRSLDQNALLALTVKVVQEQQNQIETLKAKLDKLVQ